MSTVDLVAVGCSLGGLDALRGLFTALPDAFRIPVVVVQHRSRDGGDSLADLLQTATSMHVADALDKEPIGLGRVFLAPPDYHLLVERGTLALSVDQPVAHARPSIDVLFESAADAYLARLAAVVLTGASTDGARGLARVRAHGGRTAVQAPDSAECSVMPRAAIAAGRPDCVASLPGLAAYLSRLAGV